MLNSVVHLGVTHSFAIDGKIFPEMHIVTVCAEAISIEGINDDSAFGDSLKSCGVGKYHEIDANRRRSHWNPVSSDFAIERPVIVSSF